MASLEKTKLHLGYIPLLDCAAILWADRQGYFQQAGLEVSLEREASWASLRDRLAYGFLDAAHCLSALLPAAAIAEDQPGIPLQTPLVLSVNRAFISLSQKLCFDLGISVQDNEQQAAEKVVKAIQNQHPLQLASVFQQSIHYFCLKEWLAMADEDVARNIQMSIIPPPYMVEAMKSQVIDGFCVGEPWNTEAELLGIGQMAASSQNIIPPVADKVLAVTQEWAQQNPNTLAALSAAIQKAQRELKTLQDYAEVWQMLEDYRIIRFKSSATAHVQKYYAIQNIIRNFVQDDAQPKAEDFAWLIQMMEKWHPQNMHLQQKTAQEIAQICQRCIVDYAG